MADDSAGVEMSHEKETPMAATRGNRRYRSMMEELRRVYVKPEPRETRYRDRRLSGKARRKARKAKQRAERRAQ